MYAERAKLMKASEIREPLEITEDPEIISFAGGMLAEALKAKVAYVNGAAFSADGKERNKMRLNFSNTDYKKTEEGIRRLAMITKERMS